MKKKQVVLIVSAVLILGLIGIRFFVPHERSQYIPRTVAEGQAPKGYRGAAEWLNSIQADINGKIDISKVNEARKQVREMARKKSATQEEFTWDELGPDNVGGRTRALLYDRNNPDIIYAGAVSGGLWKTTTGGLSWSKVNYSGDESTDYFANILVSCITQAANGDIYIGTGEISGSMANNFYNGQSNDLAGAGNGIWKSTDGETFTHIASTWNSSEAQSQFRFVNRLAADPVNTNLIYAATVKGLLYSTNGGDSWNEISDIPLTDRYKNAMDVKVGTDGTVIAAINGKFYIAPAGDLTAINHSITSPTVVGGRLELAIAPSDPNYIYCQASNPNGTLENIYKSIDKGQTWSVIGPGGYLTFQPLGNQGTYDNVIAVYPNNPDKIMIGGQSSMHTYSPENSWQIISDGYVPVESPLYVHADHHAIAFHPNYGNGNQTVIVGTDGGVFRSDDGGNYFYMLNKNYNVTQFFKIDCDGNGHVMGGAQDNGTLYNDFGGNTVRNFIDVNGGDGGACALSELDPRVAFGTVYFGNLRRTQEKGTSFYETGRFFFSNRILNKYWDGLEGNIGSLNYNVAPFVTLFDLWESFDDENSIDTAYWVNTPDYVAADVYQSYYNDLAAKYTDFSVDTINTVNQNGEVTVIASVTIGPNQNIVIPSKIYERPLYYTTTDYVYPGDTVKTIDTYQAMLAMPLYDTQDGLYNIWITRKPLNFEVLAANQPWSQIIPTGISAGSYNSMRDLKFSSDGNYLYFAMNNVLFRVSNLQNARTKEQLDWEGTDYLLSVDEIETFSQNINSIAVDPNDADRVMITLAGFGIGDHIWLSTNATTAASFSSKDGNLETRLPDMPIYSAIINVGNGDQAVVGTHYGVYSTDNLSDPNPDWMSQNVNGMPEVMAVHVVQQENIFSWNSGITNGGYIYIGTHGRGIFRTSAWALSTPEVPGNENVSLSDQLHIYPNPAHESVTVDLNIAQINRNARVEIYDLSGKMIQSIELNSVDVSAQKLKVNVNSIPSGNYIISLLNGTARYSGKLLVY